MMKRIFASLLVVGLLSACGDGGKGATPPSQAGDPPSNSQDPPVSRNQPPENQNRPPENQNRPSSNAAGGAAHSGDDDGHAGRGPDQSCTPAKNCAGCTSDRDQCRCLGLDAMICDQAGP